MTRNILIAALFSLLTAAALGYIFIGEAQRLPEAVAAIDGEQIERGARDYEQYCASCHGIAGQGGVAEGAPQLNNIASRYLTPGSDGVAPFDADNGIKEKYGTMTNYIESTLVSGVRGAAMPAFGAQGTLRDDQIRNITAYVLNWNNVVPEGAIVAANLEATRLAPTPDPNANPIDAAGLVFKQAGCTACHNMNDQKSAANAPGLGGLFQPEGTAAYGEQLPNGKEITDETVTEWIRAGSIPFQDSHIDPIDGQTYGVMPAFANVTDEQIVQILVWLRAHNRDGSLTPEAQALQQGGAQASDGAAPAASDGASPAASTAPETSAVPATDSSPAASSGAAPAASAAASPQASVPESAGPSPQAPQASAAASP